MNRLSIPTVIVALSSCAAVGELLPGGETQADQIGETLLSAAPLLAEQTSTLVTLFTHNPTLGEAVATIIAGIAAYFTAKKIKNGKNGNGKKAA